MFSSLRKLEKNVLAWCGYDVGNSAFATTIMAAIFPVYYSEVASLGLAPSVSTAYWAYAASASLFLSAFLSPLLGALADVQGSKKRLLALFTAIGVFSTGCMALIGPGNWLAALLLMSFGTVGFTVSIVFYDALLPTLVPASRMDMVSSQGYALGYLGGGGLLAVNFLFIAILPGTLGARLSFLSAALWWGGFTIPLLLHVEEPPVEEREISSRKALLQGALRLRCTFRDIRSYKNLFLFLVAFWFYNDGIGTIIRMAAIYGSQLGIPMNHLVGALLLTQFVAIPFSLAFGTLSSRIGGKRSILAGLYFYLCLTVTSIFISRPWHFWALAVAVGMVQGGVQAISRSFFASMIPPGRNAEFFGFYDVSSKFSGILGPAIFGIVTHLAGSSSMAIAILSYTFILGILILRKVEG
ncbi:MAG: MFS transporter [Synergistaceae bacterium]|nr:MFS transporter [Synergistota bacterium]NLM71870.1 MFS transporter [Synergistaceae bacterium]